MSIQLCSDCMLAAVNDEYSQAPIESLVVAEIKAGLQRLGWITPNFTGSESNENFSSATCECCYSTLIGARYTFETETTESE